VDRTVGNVPLAERRVMDSVFEGLLQRALKKPELTPRLKRRLLDAGVDVDAKLKPIYPHAVWVSTCTAVAEELMPGVPLEQALRQLGQRVVMGYFDTMIGGAIRQVLKAIGTRRTLGRMTQNFSAANNYTRSELVDVGERHVRLWMNELAPMHFNLWGILERGLEVAGAKNIRVKLLELDAHGCSFDIEWDER
jgi:uncharacterized protein (TIGR02265 family)